LDDPASSSSVAWVVLPLLLMMSALFSGGETALFRISDVELRRLSASSRRPHRLLSLYESPRAVLSMLLLCNTAVNVGFATIMTSVLVANLDAPMSRLRVEMLVTAVSTVLILFWGEILPKTLAAQSPSLVARRLAWPLWALSWLLRPLVAALQSIADRFTPDRARGQAERASFRVTPETMELAVDLSTEQGAIDQAESDMILGALEASETVVREVMTPRPDVARVPLDATVGQAAEVIVSTGFSRLPVFAETIDNVVGVIYVKDLLPLIRRGSVDYPIERCLRAPSFVPETKLASDLLREMRSRGELMAIVVDEYGGTAGVVTLEDLAEEIVGEIIDEFDRWEDEVERVDGGLLCSGRILVDDLNDEYELDLPTSEDVDTLGGLVYSLAGRPPKLGETFAVPGYLLTVAELRGNRACGSESRAHPRRMGSSLSAAERQRVTASRQGMVTRGDLGLVAAYQHHRELRLHRPLLCRGGGVRVGQPPYRPNTCGYGGPASSTA